MKMRTLALLLVVGLSCSMFAQEKTTAGRPGSAAKKPSGSTASSGGWEDMGDRGSVKKVWRSAVSEWPQVILLKLSTEQLTRFQADPVTFLNKPTRLFPNKIIGVWDFCQKWKTAYRTGISDQWLVMVPHSDISNSCPSFVPYVPDGATGESVKDRAKQK